MRDSLVHASRRCSSYSIVFRTLVFQIEEKSSNYATNRRDNRKTTIASGEELHMLQL
jgi:hypothetical protein